jgi:hypothetical protein
VREQLEGKVIRENIRDEVIPLLDGIFFDSDARRCTKQQKKTDPYSTLEWNEFIFLMMQSLKTKY